MASTVNLTQGASTARTAGSMVTRIAGQNQSKPSVIGQHEHRAFVECLRHHTHGVAGNARGQARLIVRLQEFAVQPAHVNRMPSLLGTLNAQRRTRFNVKLSLSATRKAHRNVEAVVQACTQTQHARNRSVRLLAIGVNVSVLTHADEQCVLSHRCVHARARAENAGDRPRAQGRQRT